MSIFTRKNNGTANNKTRKNNGNKPAQPASSSEANQRNASSPIALYYMARPVYGGWVSFTAHLSLKHKLPLYKIGSKTEKKDDGSPTLREYGYGVKYQNRGPKDLPDAKVHVITAIDKTNYQHLDKFPDGTIIVIHVPTEVTSKNTEPL